MSKISHKNTVEKTAKTVNVLRKHTLTFAKATLDHVRKVYLTEPTVDVPEAVRVLEQVIGNLKHVK